MAKVSVQGDAAALHSGVYTLHFGALPETLVPTPLLRASLTNFVEVARKVGLDPYVQLRRAGISASALLEPEARLPTKSVVRLLEESAQRSGVEDFGLRVGENRPLSTMGPLAIV